MKSRLCPLLTCALSLTLLSFSTQAAADYTISACATKSGSGVYNVDAAQEVSLIRLSDAQKLFNQLRSPGFGLPYLVPTRNCDLRAHKISQYLNQTYKLKTIKVIIEGNNFDSADCGATGASCMGQSNGSNGWKYLTLHTEPLNQTFQLDQFHTASAICVRTNRGTDELYVLDPTLFNKPVPYSAWKSNLTGGLSSGDYLAFSKPMYSSSPSWNEFQRPTSFNRSEMQRVNSILSRDISEHNSNLKRAQL